jgi:hypothetical protein
VWVVAPERVLSGKAKKFAVGELRKSRLANGSKAIGQAA